VKKKISRLKKRRGLNAREEGGGLDDSGERMNDVGIVPFPAKDDLFAGLEITKSEDAKGQGGRIWIETGTDDGIGPASTASKSSITATDAGIEGEV